MKGQVMPVGQWAQHPGGWELSAPPFVVRVITPGLVGAWVDDGGNRSVAVVDTVGWNWWIGTAIAALQSGTAATLATAQAAALDALFDWCTAIASELQDRDDQGMRARLAGATP